MILLTGATGFLGRQILGRLLFERPNERIALLIRNSLQADADSRSLSLLTELFGSADEADRFLQRIEVVHGDVSDDCFGLGESQFNALASRVTEVFHCAATTALNHDIQGARKINVGGTYQVLKLCEKAHRVRGEQFRLFYVSTAFVAGTRQGVVRADELYVDGPFRNAYERSKAEAESLVRGMQGQIPICIFRPSIIVGDSITGETSAFNVIYIPAKLLAKGLFSSFPGCPHAPFDVVPVDYVADAMVRLSSLRPASGSCYHISAGLGREPSLWEIIEQIIDTFNTHRRMTRRKLSLPQLVPLEMLSLAQSSLTVARSSMKALERLVSDRLNVFRQTLPFIPYMLGNPQFDNSETLRDLGAGFDAPPLFPSYSEPLFRYCLDTNWGKSPWTNPGELLPWHQRVQARN